MIAGIRSFSFVDYPGKLCAMVFTAGCNFRCPWCHNWKIAYGNTNNKTLNNADVFKKLEKLRERVDAICITGGEPTLHKNLPIFIKYLKDSLNYNIKLDTNGTNPEMVKNLIEFNLVDYFAIDIKSMPDKYPLITGIKRNYWSKVRETVNCLREYDVSHELRMTYVPGISSQEDVDFFEEFKEDSKSYITKANDTDIYKVGKYKKIEIKSLIKR